MTPTGGRILCALGYSGVQFDPEAIELFIESEAGRLLIYQNGSAADYSEEEATRILSCPEVTALVDMKTGEARRQPGAATFPMIM